MARCNAVGPEHGAAYVFRYDPKTSQWSQQDMLLPDPGPWTAFFGWSVAIDGETAVIGADGEDQGAGAAYVFDLNCPSDCPADLDDSGAVDFGDVLAVLEAWGNPGGPEDLDDSGTVDFGDLLIVLAAWGPCPESRPLRRPVDDRAGNTIKDIAGGGAEPWAGS